MRTRPLRAHRAEFPSVPCAPEAFPRTGLTSCARGPESEHSRETRSTRGTELCAQGTVGVRGEAFVLSPSHLSHLHCQPTPLSRMDSPAICSALRHPTSKGWGIFRAFYPYLLEASPVYTFYGIPPSKVWVFLALSSPTFQRHCHSTAFCGISPAKVWVFFALFSPTSGLHQTPAPLSFRLQNLPSDHQAGLPYSTPFFCTGRSCKCLPYTTAPFSVRNGLASASRTERGRFSVPHVSASGSRTTEGPFSVPDGESPQGYRVLRLRRSNLNTNMPLESNFRARL